MFSSWFLPSLTVDMEVPMFPAVLLSFWVLDMDQRWSCHSRPIWSRKSMLRIKPRNFICLAVSNIVYFPFDIWDVILPIDLNNIFQRGWSWLVNHQPVIEHAHKRFVSYWNCPRASRFQWLDRPIMPYSGNANEHVETLWNPLESHRSRTNTHRSELLCWAG